MSAFFLNLSRASWLRLEMLSTAYLPLPVFVDTVVECNEPGYGVLQQRFSAIPVSTNPCNRVCLHFPQVVLKKG